MTCVVRAAEYFGHRSFPKHAFYSYTCARQSCSSQVGRCCWIVHDSHQSWWWLKHRMTSSPAPDRRSPPTCPPWRGTLSNQPSHTDVPLFISQTFLPPLALPSTSICHHQVLITRLPHLFSSRAPLSSLQQPDCGLLLIPV